MRVRVCVCVERYMEFSLFTQLQRPLKKTCLGFFADLLFCLVPFTWSESLRKFLKVQMLHLPNDSGGTAGPQASVYTVFL